MKTIFKGIVGSKAYGLHNEYSDTDIKGVYRQKNDDVLGFKYKERIDVSADEVYYEVKKFIELIGKSNPTILEMLWLPPEMIITESLEWRQICRYKEYVLTKECKNSYIGYAKAQIKKAKNNRNAKNLMHVFRLIMSAKQIALSGMLSPRLEPDQIILCKEIKSGVIDFAEAILLSESLIKEVDIIFDACKLPDKIDHEVLHGLLVEIRKFFTF